MSNWNTISAIVQGDLTFELKKRELRGNSVEILLTAFSEKWAEFDVAFEYFSDNEWRKDAQVIAASGAIEGNKILGVIASKYGTENIIVWNYTKNNLRYGLEPKIRIKVLPRIKSFSTSGNYHVVTNVYGEHNVDIEDSTTTQRCIGTNNSGQAICLTDTELIIKSSASGSVIYSYGWLLFPSIAIQTLSGTYIIADTGNNRVIELSEDLSTLIKVVSVDTPLHIDFSEARETLLVTTQGSTDIVYELTWSEWSYGVVSWDSSDTILNQPYSATYKQDNSGYIIISDTGNNQIVLYNGDLLAYSRMSRYKISKDDPTYEEQTLFYKPYRSYWYGDGDICVIEKEGHPWTMVDESSSQSFSSESSSSQSLGGMGFMYIEVGGPPIFTVS